MELSLELPQIAHMSRQVQWQIMEAFLTRVASQFLFSFSCVVTELFCHHSSHLPRPLVPPSSLILFFFYCVIYRGGVWLSAFAKTRVSWPELNAHLIWLLNVFISRLEWAYNLFGKVLCTHHFEHEQMKMNRRRRGLAPNNPRSHLIFYDLFK